MAQAEITTLVALREAEAACTRGPLYRNALVDLNQTAPMSEAKPGLDGADWNCRRPDGSRRCFSSRHDQ
jgi:hypothetical protein